MKRMFFHMTSADNVTFATHADNPESEPNTYHAFMMSSGETDPLEQNDPWSSATTHSWSVPTSAPRSFGPITSAGRPTTQASWFPFGAFGRRSTTSEPAISHSSDQSRVVPPSTPRTERPLNPGYVPPEPRPFPVNAPGNPSQPVDEPPAEATAGRNPAEYAVGINVTDASGTKGFAAVPCVGTAYSASLCRSTGV